MCEEKVCEGISHTMYEGKSVWGEKCEERDFEGKQWKNNEKTMSEENSERISVWSKSVWQKVCEEKVHIKELLEFVCDMEKMCKEKVC